MVLRRSDAAMHAPRRPPEPVEDLTRRLAHPGASRFQQIKEAAPNATFCVRLDSGLGRNERVIHLNRSRHTSDLGQEFFT